MRSTQQHQAIWQQVVLAAVRRYHLPLDWLHYDITSTYFEGAYSESELIKFGYSRDQRPDSKQLNIGLTTLRHGLPLAFQVLVGNTADQDHAAPEPGGGAQVVGRDPDHRPDRRA